MQADLKAPMCSAVVVVALASATHASVIPQMGLDGLYRQADVAVQGVVLDQRSQWLEYDGNRLIFTFSTVEVTSSAKREAPRRLVVRTVGGSVDGFNQALIGEANLSPGEEVVLFLQNEQAWDTPSVVGFHQGKFRVQRDASGTVTSLSRDRGQRPFQGAPESTWSISPNAFTQRIDSLDRPDAPLEDGVGAIHPLTPASAQRAGTGALFPLEPLAAEDVNADGSVDLSDFSALVGAWRSSDTGADINADGTVDIDDLSRLVDALGR